MKKWVKPLVFIVLGGVIAFPLFSMTYYTMVRTSTPQFCGSCHEIVPAVETWKLSTHHNNDSGVVADCMDCHLPAPQRTFDFFYSKTYHGIKDVVAHFTMDEYDREKNRQKAYASLENDQCMKCHRNLLHLPDNRGAMLAHRSVIYPMPGYEKRCVDCHRNLVHMPSDSYRYRGPGRPYISTGLPL